MSESKRPNRLMIFNADMGLLDPLTNEQRGAVLKALFDYWRTGDTNRPADPVTAYLLGVMIQKADRQSERYTETCETNRKNRQRTVANRSEPSRTVTKKEEEEEKEEEARRRNKKGGNPPNPPCPGEEYLSEPLREKYQEWLQYKNERGEGYRDIGRRSLVEQLVRAEQKHGAGAVIAIINTAMSNGYKGIPFDRLDRKQDTEPTGAELAFLMAQEAREGGDSVWMM